jgi:hypothetical protein
LDAWSEHLLIQETATDAGIATDLAAGAEQDSDFYCFVIDSNSKQEISAARTWANANHRMFVGLTIDSDVGSSADDDIGSVVYDAQGYYSKVVYSDNMSAAMDAAILGKVMGGGPTFGWEFNKIAVAKLKRTPTFIGHLGDKEVGYMKFDRGETFSYSMKFPGRYADLTRGFDWLKDRLEAALLRTLLNGAPEGGIGFTNAGIGRFRAAIMGEAVAAIGEGLLSTDGADGKPSMPYVKTVDVSTVSTADKLARTLNGLVLYGVLQGKIEKANIKVIVTP